MDYPTNPKKLEKCGHTFCKECIDEYFQYKLDCPSCDNIQMKVTGDQPPGSISIEKTYTTGIYGGIIHVKFMFEDGYQGKEHPEPGKKYKGSTFSSYVRNNMKGRLVAKLLNVAFSRRLVFTIGHHGDITSNGIHHIAKLVYSDPTHMYLDKVLEELKDKGVTEESADDPEEYKEYSKRFNY